ncbi:MAG: HIT domain-containing protein [bacterium]|nr:HIT domain-containing protein [bacterium]
MDDTCTFCRIAKGEIPADKVYEDEAVLAFKDINPTAPVHVLVIPKAHIADLSAIDGQVEVAGKLQAIIGKLARQLGIDGGYKVSLNAGRFQEVPHLHYHLQGGW